jgi:hypothetical protein
MRRRGAAALFVVASAFAVPTAARGDARADGTRAYRAGRYAAALAAFETAAKLQPSDPEALADVALALQKLGRNDEAVAANRKVVELAARPGKLKAAKRARIRQGAYFNLGKLGQQVRVPEADACGTIETDPNACKKRLFACRKSRMEAGSAIATVWDVLRVARDKESATFVTPSDDYEDEYHDYPPLIHGVSDRAYNGKVLREDELSQQEGDGVLRYGDEETGNECARIHGSEWTCEDSEAVRVETLRCLGQTEGGPGWSLRKSLATAPCFQKVCERAEKTPWPAVTKEEDEHTKTLFACYDAQSEIEDTTCVVVYADACAGTVGMYCTTSVEHEKGKPKPDRHKAYEIKIPPETRTGS